MRLQIKDALYSVNEGKKKNLATQLEGEKEVYFVNFASTVRLWKNQVEKL